MKRHIIAYFVFSLIIASPAYASIFLGTVDGYVFNMSGGLVQEAMVTATVPGCSGGEANGCSGYALSQSNGYYVIANLNNEAGGTILLNATKTLNGHFGHGSAIAIADQFKAGRANITLCYIPSSPLLVNQEDTHSSQVTLHWTSGTDPFGFSTYDEFRINEGGWEIKSSGVSLNLSYSYHTWQVRTCNNVCCSPAALGSFTIYNTAPTTPTTIPVNDTHNSTIIFQWINGSDIDGDVIYHQFQLDSQPIINNTFSPLLISNVSLGSHIWKVRACDFLECGPWAQNSFSVVNSHPSAPTLNIQGHTTSTSVSLSWTSGTDNDEDATYDEFEFSERYDFSELINLTSPAHSPVSIAGLAPFDKYYWRVRTCDMYECGQWSSGSFVKYQCVGGVPSGSAGRTSWSGIAPPFVQPAPSPEPESEYEPEIVEKEYDEEKTEPVHYTEAEIAIPLTPPEQVNLIWRVILNKLFWLFSLILMTAIIIIILGKKKKGSGHNLEMEKFRKELLIKIKKSEKK